jgi:hypothetical protein
MSVPSYLDRLAARARGDTASIRPRVLGRFEPPGADEPPLREVVDKSSLGPRQVGNQEPAPSRSAVIKQDSADHAPSPRQGGPLDRSCEVANDVGQHAIGDNPQLARQHRPAEPRHDTEEATARPATARPDLWPSRLEPTRRIEEPTAQSDVRPPHAAAAVKREPEAPARTLPTTLSPPVQDRLAGSRSARDTAADLQYPGVRQTVTRTEAPVESWANAARDSVPPAARRSDLPLWNGIEAATQRVAAQAGVSPPESAVALTTVSEVAGAEFSTRPEAPGHTPLSVEAEAQVIEVTIAQVEVRATPAREDLGRQRARRRERPPMPLEEYLRQRSGTR